MADQKELTRQLIEKVKEQQQVGTQFQTINKEVDELKTAIAQEAINTLEAEEAVEPEVVQG
tara:strand:+ start:3698 stop:3880 length:183 start_codon:yes stop_codon:yes gene_type:complete